MKLTVMTALCLLLLLNISFSLAKKSIGLGKRINLFKKTPKIKTNLGTKPKTKQQFNQGGYPQQPGNQPVRPGGYPNQGGYPQQPGNQPVRPGGYPNQGGYPQQPGNQPFRPGGYPNQGGYPQQPGNQPFRPWSYPNQGGYPAGGYPAGGYPVGGYPYGGYGGYGGHGGYPGGYYNYNPHNNIMSPRYGGSYGYGGYGGGGGSPFSHSVQAMGVFPQDKSRGFGRGAVMAAAGGAMAGMALGYGLGRFPRPPFHFHSPQEEYYYNHYMYRKYGVKSTDTNDYGRDYRYVQPTLTYDRYMDSCMKRTDLLPVVNQKSKNKPAATTTTTTATTTTTTTTSITTTTTAAPSTGIGSNTTRSNGTATENSSTSAPSTRRPLNESEAGPSPPASQAIRRAATDDGDDGDDDDDDDDDTVSIVEIGYPALIRQMKVRRCLELYMVYSEKYLNKRKEPSPNDGALGLEMLGLRRFLSVITSIVLALLNSNKLTLLH
ncbi:uncharacterized protein LOC118313749 [Scophthalmus maximus]|nr:uncharacterized protein LOC118313749 [Scophthalmus maximus]